MNEDATQLKIEAWELQSREVATQNKLLALQQTRHQQFESALNLLRSDADEALMESRKLHADIDVLLKDQDWETMDDLNRLSKIVELQRKVTVMHEGLAERIERLVLLTGVEN